MRLSDVSQIRLDFEATTRKAKEATPTGKTEAPAIGISFIHNLFAKVHSPCRLWLEDCWVLLPVWEHSKFKIGSRGLLLTGSVAQNRVCEIH